MTAFSGEIHPLAARYPMLPDEELQELAESIARDGLDHPLVLDPEGRLVDGRNRLAACDMVDASPDFVTNESLVAEEKVRAFIARQNANRRHFSTGQKAMALADDLAARGQRRNGRWAYGSKIRESGDSSKAWTEAIREAGLVIDHRPDLVDDVIRGHRPDDPDIKVTLHWAAEEAAKVRDAEARAAAEAKRQAEMLADLNDNRPDLAALVDRGDLSLEDALTVRDRETAEQRRAEREAEELIQKFSIGVCSAIARLTTLTEPTLADQVAALRLDVGTTLITSTEIDAAVASLHHLAEIHKERL